MRISVGLDVAKAVHWACAIDDAGRTLLDRAVENTPEGIASFAADLRALGGEPVVGLDVVGSFAHFLGASLLAEGFRLVHAPGIAVNRAGQGFAGGERKSDPRDARTIADLVRTRELRPILPDDETVMAIRLKVGRRRDLIEEQTRRLNRLRGLLSSIHPGLERDLDVTCKGPLVLLTRYVTPAEIRLAGKRRIMAQLAKTPHMQGVEAQAKHALAAAGAQMLAVPGEAAMAELVRELATEPRRGVAGKLGQQVFPACRQHDVDSAGRNLEYERPTDPVRRAGDQRPGAVCGRDPAPGSVVLF
jgi:hypothetical protein